MSARLAKAARDCKMALLKYFKKNSVLPDPNGPLSRSLPSSSISAANKAVKPLLDAAEGKTTEGKTTEGKTTEGKTTEGKATGRGKYSMYSEVEKLKIARRAAEMGVTNTMRHFQSEL